MTGMPIWYELMTPDIEAVREFYRTVGGWNIPDSGSPVGTGAMDYRAVQRANGGMAWCLSTSARRRPRPGMR